MPQREYKYNTPLAHRICEKLELPEDVCRNCSHIEITSDCCAMVDGCKGVLEYNENTIRFSLAKGGVKFTGNGLSIRSLTQQQAIVDGLIISIEFCGD